MLIFSAPSRVSPELAVYLFALIQIGLLWGSITRGQVAETGSDLAKPLPLYPRRPPRDISYPASAELGFLHRRT